MIGTSIAGRADMRIRIIATLVGVAVALPACMPSSTYMPRDSRRLVIIYKHGQPFYRRDGREWRASPGLLHDHLEDAVGDDPEARELAAKANAKRRSGLDYLLLGTAGLIAGEVMLLVAVGKHDKDPTYRPSDTYLGVSIGAMVVGLYGYGAAFDDMSQVPILTMDAINKYNDDVDTTQAAPFPPPPRNVRPPIDTTPPQ
jgi:hypothetical protein